MRTLLIAMVLLAAPPTLAHAQGTAPRRPHLVMHEQLVLLLNPMGTEHRLDAAVRSETGDADDLLTQGTHVEGGISTAVSPVYAVGGGYVQASPLSFLVLRGSIEGISVWPIGMDGAGHYGITGYDADVHSQNLSADDAGSASGFLATVSGTLQGAVEVGDGVRLLMGSELALTYASVGDASFYYSMKHDLILAQRDFVLMSSSFLGVEVRAASDIVLRFGAYDDLRYVPASGYVGHQLGPLAMIEWQRIDPTLPALAIFVRGGAYTHHVTRAEEATVLAGLSIDYDLGGL